MKTNFQRNLEFKAKRAAFITGASRKEEEGAIGTDLLIALVLTMFTGIGGIIYLIWAWMFRNDVRDNTVEMTKMMKTQAAQTTQQSARLVELEEKLRIAELEAKLAKLETAQVEETN